MFQWVRQGVLLAVFMVLVVGCVTTDSNTATTRGFMSGKQKRVSQAKDLAPGDGIEVSVEVDGNMEVFPHRAQINRQGMVTLPLVGDVEVGGCTLNKARGIIAKTYGAYYVVPPVIMISLLGDPEDGEWGFVTVMGRVGQPGRIPLRNQHGMNLTEAIQLTGGFAASAKRTDIQVSRTDELGMKIQVSVDFEQIGQVGNADADIMLIDGDIVYVPERIF